MSDDQQDQMSLGRIRIQVRIRRPDPETSRTSPPPTPPPRQLASERRTSPLAWLLLIFLSVACIGIIVVSSLAEGANVTQEEWAAWAEETFPIVITREPELSDSQVTFSVEIFNEDDQPHLVEVSSVVNVTWTDGYVQTEPDSMCDTEEMIRLLCDTRFYVRSVDLRPGGSETLTYTFEGYPSRPFEVSSVEPIIVIISVDGDRLDREPRPQIERDEEWTTVTAEAERITAAQKAVDQGFVTASLEDLEALRREDDNTIHQLVV